MAISEAIEAFCPDYTSTVMDVLNKNAHSEAEPNSKHAIPPGRRETWWFLVNNPDPPSAQD
jgi:hypothetical protein